MDDAASGFMAPLADAARRKRSLFAPRTTQEASVQRLRAAPSPRTASHTPSQPDPPQPPPPPPPPPRHHGQVPAYAQQGRLRPLSAERVVSRGGPSVRSKQAWLGSITSARGSPGKRQKSARAASAPVRRRRGRRGTQDFLANNTGADKSKQGQRQPTSPPASAAALAQAAACRQRVLEKRRREAQRTAAVVSRAHPAGRLEQTTTTITHDSWLWLWLLLCCLLCCA